MGHPCFMPLATRSVPTSSPAKRRNDSHSAHNCLMLRNMPNGSPRRARLSVIQRRLGNAVLKSKNTAAAIMKRTGERDNMADSTA